VEFSSCHPSLGLSRRGAGMKREPSRASLLPRIILFSNHPLTISFQRRGTSLTPILSEDGEGGGDNPLSINELNSTLARQKPAAEQSHPQNKFGRFDDGVRPMERAELRETRGRRVSRNKVERAAELGDLRRNDEAESHRNRKQRADLGGSRSTAAPCRGRSRPSRRPRRRGD